MMFQIKRILARFIYFKFMENILKPGKIKSLDMFMFSQKS